MMQSEKCLGKDPTDHAFRHRDAVDSEKVCVSHGHKQDLDEVDKIRTPQEGSYLTVRTRQREIRTHELGAT